MSFMSGLVLGAVIGASVALLTAPEPGRRTRRRIQRSANDFRDTATDRWEDLADEVRGKVDDALEGARGKLGQ
ncbi:MAG: YtxH domain-containing protein [Gemmatimonadota bacterium]